MFLLHPREPLAPLRTLVSIHWLSKISLTVFCFQTYSYSSFFYLLFHFSVWIFDFIGRTIIPIHSMLSSSNACRYHNIYVYDRCWQNKNWSRWSIFFRLSTPINKYANNIYKCRRTEKHVRLDNSGLVYTCNTKMPVCLHAFAYKIKIG